jgi:hypothetical protein
MGLLETVLCPHLEALTKVYTANKLQLLSKYESGKFKEIHSEQYAKFKRQMLNDNSENFRQRGNQFFKAQDFNQSLFMYTKSIAAAIEGPPCFPCVLQQVRSHQNYSFLRKKLLKTVC